MKYIMDYMYYSIKFRTFYAPETRDWDTQE